jgi:Putative porin
VGRYTFGVTVDAVRNLAYNAAEVSTNFGGYIAARTKGYQTEVSFGYPTVLTAGAWRGVLGYRYLQRDAVIDAYTDSDFHFGGTDATGYYFIGDLGLVNRVWARLRYMSSNAIDGARSGIDTIQVDLNTRF